MWVFCSPIPRERPLLLRRLTTFGLAIGLVSTMCGSEAASLLRRTAAPFTPPFKPCLARSAEYKMYRGHFTSDHDTSKKIAPHKCFLYSYSVQHACTLTEDRVQTSIRIHIYSQPIDRLRQFPTQDFSLALQHITETLETLLPNPQITNLDFNGSYHTITNAKDVHIQVVVIEDYLPFCGAGTERAISELQRGRCLLFILTDIFGGVSTSARRRFSKLEEVATNGHVFTLIGLKSGALDLTLRKVVPHLPK